MEQSQKISKKCLSPTRILPKELRIINQKYGRRYTLPAQTCSDIDCLAATFVPEPGFESPTLEIRGGSGDQISSWQRWKHPVPIDWDWFEVRVMAATDPVPLTTAFEAELRDTWVVTGPPETQNVPWTFISPTGNQVEIDTRYVGDSRWQVNFVPQELGRWRYYWEQNFISTPYRSETGIFDVVAGSRDSLAQASQELLQSVRQFSEEPPAARFERFNVPFMRLERAVMQTEKPKTFHTDSPPKIRSALDNIRKLLAKKPMQGSADNGE